MPAMIVNVLYSDRMGGHYNNVITAQPKREDFHRPTNPSGSGSKWADYE